MDKKVERMQKSVDGTEDCRMETILTVIEDSVIPSLEKYEEPSLVGGTKKRKVQASRAGSPSSIMVTTTRMRTPQQMRYLQRVRSVRLTQRTLGRLISAHEAGFMDRYQWH